MKLYNLFQKSNLLKVYAVQGDKKHGLLWTLNRKIAGKFSESESLRIIELYKNKYNLILESEEII